MKQAAILLADGFEEIEALGTVDILRRGQINVDIVSTKSILTVVSSRKIIVTADKLFVDMNDYDMIILPGGLPGASSLRDDPKVIKLLQDYSSRNKYIAAICAGPMALGKAGIAVNKKVTSYPDDETKSYLKESDYQDDDSVVVDGHLITSRGPGTTFAFAYKLLELLEADPSPLKQGMLYRKYND
ncbi:DJ-1 family protein [Eggerthia catenaformis OT 569 = DSM 20559]|uniref:DJ-1 family protein n=1 Tax=Eggerthia catenaformis OT 569 = DSM 20559 TaxID=999415 RepID=M2PB45_9FIRM|nr:DJ-1 family glyoxalase III [Eggerthia catenaformis]EMD17587.1 DJ-1 family protein [Eggerthia catenaformis OT 569 = DSM 20559]